MTTRRVIDWITYLPFSNQTTHMFPEINRVSLTVGTDVWSCCGKGRPIRDLPFWNVLAYTVFQLSQHLFYIHYSMRIWEPPVSLQTWFSVPSPPQATAVFGLRGNAAYFIILMSRTQTAALPPRVLSDFNPSSFMKSNGGEFSPAEGRMGGCGQANVTWPPAFTCHIILETLRIRKIYMISVHTHMCDEIAR